MPAICWKSKTPIIILDSNPVTLTGESYRPAYGTDGDYFSKPSLGDIMETAFIIMDEFDPERFLSI